MSMFKVKAQYLTYCYLDVEAQNEDEAMEIAENTDGGDFMQYDDLEQDSIEITGAEEF